MAKRRTTGEVRWAVIGLGTIGVEHAWRVARTPRARLVAVASRNPARAAVAESLGCEFYTDTSAMLRSGRLDAVLIATPHDSHVPLARAAVEAGLHALVEKPLAVDPLDGRGLAELARRRRRKVGVMFQMRTEPVFQTLAAMLREGRLGRLQRLTWIVTDWFRADAYFRAAPWRGTWAGEGGGLLVNQCPHQLDLLLWFLGPPRRVRATAGYGRWHPIETEDDVTAVLEYRDGLTATFIASTGEAPGTRRLEIAGTKGTVVHEGSRLTLRWNRIPSDRFARSARDGFSRPPVREESFECPTAPIPPHEAVIRNFVSAILDGDDLIAPVSDGVREVELAAALQWAALDRREVELPLNGRGFRRRLQRVRDQGR